LLLENPADMFQDAFCRPAGNADIHGMPWAVFFREFSPFTAVFEAADERFQEPAMGYRDISPLFGQKGFYLPAGFLVYGHSPIISFSVCVNRP